MLNVRSRYLDQADVIPMAGFLRLSMDSRVRGNDVVVRG
jgi:hypothetical protein